MIAKRLLCGGALFSMAGVHSAAVVSSSVTLVLAHRGASKAFPENTVEAFEGAAAMRADGVELDVRRTSDGVLVCVHDAEIAGVGFVSSKRANELPASVATLQAALDACVGMQVVNVEIKNMPTEAGHDPSHRIADEVVELVCAHSMKDSVIISSFNHRTIDRVREIDGAPPTGVLLHGTFAGTITAWRREKVDRVAAIAKDSGHVALHPYHRWVGRAFVEAAHAQGLAVNVWTVDDPKRMAKLCADGVDAIITNLPDVARTISALTLP